MPTKKFVKLPWDTVDFGQLAILPTTDTEKITQDIALLFAVDFRHILVRAHLGNKLEAVSFLKLRKRHYYVDRKFKGKIYLVRKLHYLKQIQCTLSVCKLHKVATKM